MSVRRPSWVWTLAERAPVRFNQRHSHQSGSRSMSSSDCSKPAGTSTKSKESQVQNSVHWGLRRGHIGFCGRPVTIVSGVLTMAQVVLQPSTSVFLTFHGHVLRRQEGRHHARVWDVPPLQNAEFGSGADRRRLAQVPEGDERVGWQLRRLDHHMRSHCRSCMRGLSMNRLTRHSLSASGIGHFQNARCLM